MPSLFVPKNQLKAFCTELFCACGLSKTDAEISSDVLITADARAIPSHGIARLGRYITGLKTGLMLPNAKPRIIKETPTALVIDAGGGLGAPASVFAMQAVITKAASAGMAMASVRNSNHFGIAGYYAMMALEPGMIGLSMTNTAALGVPTFGRHAMFGTNPLAFAAPAGQETPFVLDMSTTTVTRGKIETYDRASQPLPAGWALDSDGTAILDPLKLLDNLNQQRGGGLVPLGGDSELLGGHKGYGLAVMVDILTGLLAAANFGPAIIDTKGSSARVSHCFAAIRIDLFRDPNEFRSDMDQLLAALRQSPPAAGSQRVYYAGLKEAEAEAEADIRGIALTDKVVSELKALGAAYGLTFPPASEVKTPN